MARKIRNARLVIVSRDGQAQSARVDYEVWIGNAMKQGSLAIEGPDWGKILHRTGAINEFWCDAMAAVAAKEKVS